VTDSMMEYLPPAGSGPLKYTGQVASGYDAKREQSPKWTCEQRIIESWIDDMPEGSVILDAPCGTGRFFSAYERNKHLVLGLDISPDMIAQARVKITQPNLFKFGIGDVRSVPLENKQVDATINVRITRWLSPSDCVRMMKEMQRVSKDRIIITARVANHLHARTVELFQSALEEDWSIVRNEVGYVMDYRVLMFQRKK